MTMALTTKRGAEETPPNTEQQGVTTPALLARRGRARLGMRRTSHVGHRMYEAQRLLLQALRAAVRGA